MVKKLLTQIKHKTLTGEEVVMDIGAKASNVLPENFVEQKERSNLTTKDKLPVIFGKLSKWYADLRPVAWSGNYSDLTNKPTIPEGSAANYQVANNDTTEAEGFVADARIVRTHGLEIDGLSRDLGGLSFAQDAEGNWGYKIGGADPVIPFKITPKFHVVSTGDSIGLSTYAVESKKIAIPPKDGETAVGAYIENIRVYNSNHRLGEATISAVYSNGILTVSCPAGTFSEGWSSYYFDVVGIYI